MLPAAAACSGLLRPSCFDRRPAWCLLRSRFQPPQNDHCGSWSLASYFLKPHHSSSQHSACRSLSWRRLSPSPLRTAEDLVPARRTPCHSSSQYSACRSLSSEASPALPRWPQPGWQRSRLDSARPQDKGTGLATKAVEAQDKDIVLNLAPLRQWKRKTKALS